VIERLATFQRDGHVSRVGAIFAPGTIGASTLAALEVPLQRLGEVAQFVNAFPEVNHNYEREHRIDLWFVAAADSEERLRAVLAQVEDGARCGPLLVLPLLQEFRIDLGFDLRGDTATVSDDGAHMVGTPLPLTAPERHMLAALQDGLPLVASPFSALGQVAGMTEAEVLERLCHWTRAGAIRRLGVIVRHRELGYRANAMVVWDAPDDLVHRLGMDLARQEGVTLCYRRARAQPRWPFNLYCMVHGRSREAVLERLDRIDANTGLPAFPREVLFSRTRFKQTGARHLSAKALAYG
jgi:DNA-binding Lrp family transcriptional regulator